MKFLVLFLFLSIPSYAMNDAIHDIELNSYDSDESLTSVIFNPDGIDEKDASFSNQGNTDPSQTKQAEGLDKDNLSTTADVGNYENFQNDDASSGDEDPQDFFSWVFGLFPHTIDFLYNTLSSSDEG